MKHHPQHSLLFCFGLSAAALLSFTTAAGAQTAAVGLSTVRAQRFGNDNLQGFFTPQTTDLFAYSLAAGDFNGDGADDLATGMPFDNGLAASPINDSGSVVVRYSTKGDGLTTNPSQVYLRQTSDRDPAEAGDEYGYSLAACDFNGDGQDDLAIGIPYENYAGHYDAGAVQIHYSAHQTGDAFYTESTTGITGDVEDYDEFGTSLACGDFNADGFDDLAIGVPQEEWIDWTDQPCTPGVPCELAMGMVVVIPGSSAGLVPSAGTHFDQDVDGMNGTADNGDFFGWSLAAGDFSGDGFDDLAIGVPGEDDDQGAIHVVFGGSSGLSTAGNLLMDETFVGGNSEQGDRFGESLAAGDFDHDGFADLAIGIPFEDLSSSATNAGQVSVLYGSSGGFNRNRTQFWSENLIFGAGTSETNDSFGYALTAGDFDKDGFADLAMSNPAEFITGGQDGAITVIMGSAAGLTSTRRRSMAAGVEGFPGDLNQHGKYFGFSLASGDFDGDGHGDLTVGTPWEDEGGIADVGAETVLYGALFADGFENGSTSFWSHTVATLYFNKVQVTSAARLGPLSSKVGLQVDLFNPTIQRPAAATYIRVDPDRGFNSERVLKGSFFVNPQNLTMSTAAGANSFQMIAFNDGVGPGSKTRLIFSLVRNPADGDWFINVLHFNENLGAFQVSASGFFAPDNTPSASNNRIEFEWRGGNPGQITMWRTQFVNGAPDVNGRIQMFSAGLPGMQFATINHVFAGMFAGQRSGTYGTLYLDEFSFRR
ncbi:MAG TPA: FG-GAP repeat protein [Thermoanaerobaculia bacterium]|jgi:hypothetical protein|nr:FG-GAP repeat protein [Thermoanaerobaculia bacterium]